jgi:hypothetical protein
MTTSRLGVGSQSRAGTDAAGAWESNERRWIPCRSARPSGGGTLHLLSRAAGAGGMFTKTVVQS